MSARPAALASVEDGRVHPTPREQPLTQWCAGMAGGIALLALAGWVLDLRLLAGQWGPYVPMPPSAALAVLLIAGGIFSFARWPSHDLVRRASVVGASVAGLIALLVLVQLVTGYDSGIEGMLARASEAGGQLIARHMSPLSAAALLVECTAFVAMLYLCRWRVAAHLALVLTLLVTGLGLVVLLGYLYGVPPLYGGPIRPMAAPTAVALVLMGVGQICLLLPHVPAPQAWRRDTTRGILVRAFLPAVLLYVIFDGWVDTWSGEVFQSTNPALWHALLAVSIGGLFVPIIAWVARRTGDEIERAHTAQRASEEQFRLAVNATNDGMWDVNLQDGTVRFNESYVAAFGGPPAGDDALLWWSEHVHPDDRDRTVASFDTAVNGSGDVWKCEYRFRRIDGTWANTSDRAHISRDATGKAQYVIGALSDITEARRAEEALRTSEGRYRALIEEASDGIFVTNREGRFVEVNPAGCALLGRTAPDILSLTIADVVAYSQETPLRIPKLFRGETIVGERQVIRKDHTLVPVEISARQLPDGRIQGIVRDITERRHAEEEKIKLEAQLRQAQKMEAVGRLAGGVAHDFNNMLGVILGHAELAAEQVSPGQPLHADIEEIRKAAVRSAALTRQLLAFARKQTVLPMVLDLNEVVTGMLTMLRRLIGEDIDLQWQPGGDLWAVNIDPSQIDQTLANLCINARDAITGVGTLTIGTGNRVLDEAYCTAHAGCVPGQYVRLAVTDNGCGMDEETLVQIFEPFFTTKAVGQGTGLGLATVYGAVKQNDGYIDVVSKPGTGSTFAIYLPRHADAVKQVQKEGAARLAQRGHETILLVEDEPSVLSLSKRMLEHQGYTVLVAGGPADASRLASQHSGTINLLITDVIMPEMNGRTLAKDLLSTHPDLKCVFMSGYTADVIAHHGVLDKGVQFIQKPFSTEDLASKVREALDAQD